MIETTKKFASIRKVFPVHQVTEGEGFVVNRVFPTRSIFHIDPFLLLDELPPNMLSAGEAKGTPPHPHKGFEILSYLLKGEMHHEDSLGNKATLFEGDVQWMTAGRGIVHKEQPSDKLKIEGGIWHGFQIWVNLPATKKNIAPAYQEIRKADIPIFHGERFIVKVLVGEAFGVSSPIKTHTPIQYHHFILEPKASVELSVHADHHSFFYPLSGVIQLGNLEDQQHFERGYLPMLEQDGNVISVSNPSESIPAEYIFLSGLPLNEPVARYGPFVMNSEMELERAFFEFQSGQMGTLAD